MAISRWDHSRAIYKKAAGTDDRSYVFGGYVRDLVRYDRYDDKDLQFKDMDFFFQSQAEFGTFRTRLAAVGYSLVEEYNPTPYTRDSMLHDKYNVYYNGMDINISIDAVINTATKHKFTPVDRQNIDADVNSFKIINESFMPMFATMDNASGKPTTNNWTAFISSIHKKTFNIQPGTTPARYQKLLDKGYKCNPGQALNDFLADYCGELEELNQLKYKKEVIKKSVAQTTSKENIKMTNVSFMDMMKSDGEDAAYRVAGSQMTNGTKKALIKLLEKQGHTSESLKALTDLLETEAGNAAIAFALGMLLHYMPQINTDLRVQKLSKEFRVHGMSTAGNAVAGLLTESLLPVILESLNSLPQPSQSAQLRVATPAAATSPEIQEDEVEEIPIAKKQMVK